MTEAHGYQGWDGVQNGGYDMSDIEMDTNQYYNSPAAYTLGFIPQQQNYQNDDFQKPGMIYSPPQQKMYDDDFQKAQYILLEGAEPMDQGMGDGQMQYPEGELIPYQWDQKVEQPYIPLVGNNNVNNNGYLIQPEPNIHPWNTLEPISPAIPQAEIDGQLQMKVFQEIDDSCKKEKGRAMAVKYSADCLAKKHKVKLENSKLADTLQDQAKMLETENILSQDSLNFAVDVVLKPILGDNNSNYDFTYFEQIEEAKEQILEAIDVEKQQDVEFQEKVQNLKDANEKHEKAVFDQAHKDTIPVFITDSKGTRQVSNKTLATRVNRMKNLQETCKYDYDAAVHQFKIKRQERISFLLNEHWQYFTPILREILENPPQRLLEHVAWTHQTDKLSCLRQILFNPG